ncbi:MAG TPA: OsmC family protein [Anaerolineales bacterium]|nr:OsmC family protein [Anaerolineales bacterium]
MLFKGHVHNSGVEHAAEVAIGDKRMVMPIAARASGHGSSVSGGELLMLALATCYCNDVYREAARMGIEVADIDVECSADFAAEGAAASDVVYSAKISAKASEARIRELAEKVDGLAEIHNTVRAAIPVKLGAVEIVSL